MCFTVHIHEPGLIFFMVKPGQIQHASKQLGELRVPPCPLPHTGEIEVSRCDHKNIDTISGWAK